MLEPTAMVSRTPTEIWQKILRYSISVPVFFETDPEQTCSPEEVTAYHYELPYWSAERHRNVLRRVCTSWNEYLVTFNHRYIRLTDVFHGRVHARDIPLAIRLNVQSDESCRCQQHCKLLRDSEPSYSDSWMWAKALSEGIEAQLRLALALGVTWHQETIITNFNISNDILAPLCLGSSGLRGVVGSLRAALLLPSLQYLVFDTDDVEEIEPGMHHNSRGELSVHLGNLTTLHLSVYEPQPSLGGFSLPSLQNLSVKYHVHPERDHITELDELIALLKGFGPSIRSLYHYGEGNSNPIPATLWTLCPKLERLQSSLFWDHSPPRGHPLHTVRIVLENVVRNMSLNMERGMSNERLIELLVTGVHRYMPPLAPEDGRVFNIVTLGTWGRVFQQSSVHTMASLECHKVARDHGFSFTDVEGVTFEQYIVQALTLFWRRKTSKIFPYRPSRIVLDFPDTTFGV